MSTPTTKFPAVGENLLDDSGFLQGAGLSLLRGEGYFRDVLEALPAAVYVTDPAGLITYYNTAAAALWGHHPPSAKASGAALGSSIGRTAASFHMINARWPWP